MVVNFIHAADLHLGSRLNTVGSESQRMQKILQDATYSAFSNIIDICIEEEVEFLVISGDIYDEDSRSVKANQFLAEQMERLQEKNIDAYIIHGNHDPINRGEEFIELPDNVHVFDSETSEKIEHSENVEIIGQSYRTKHESRKMVSSYSPVKSKISIGLLHTELDPENNDYVPVSKDDLKQKDIDYWALGHIHQTKVYEDNFAAFPGIPQGRHIEEKGVGGCIKVQIEKNSSPQLEFIPVSPVSWREKVIDAEEESFESLSDIERKGIEIAKKTETRFEHIDLDIKSDSFELEGFVFRWVLKGHSSIHSQFEDTKSVQVLKENIRNSLEAQKPFVWTEEVKVRTRPPLPNIEDVEENEVVQGFEELVESIDNDTEFKEDLKSEKGKVWREVEDKEDVNEDQLALTEEKLDELIDRAEKKLKDEILRRTI